MTDRALLELAAESAGIQLDGLADDYICQGVGPDDYLRVNSEGGHSVWNPLNYDGDALRLVVKLKMSLVFGANYVIANDTTQYPTVNNANDTALAVRRAIVRAAAEMGKTK